MQNCPTRTTLGFEALEERSLMAGNITAAVFGQNLYIQGDAEANGLAISHHPATGEYRLLGQDAGGSPTTINGIETFAPGNTISFPGVKAIVIIMGDGDDTLEFGSPVAVDFALSKYLAIDMGEGNDSVAFGKAGNTTGSTEPRAARLRTGTGIYLNMQGGDDTVEIANLDVGGH